MLLPDSPRLAVRCLDLYPAQTVVARSMRAIFRALLSISLPAGLPRQVLRIAQGDPLLSVLGNLTATPPGEVPEFGVLAGNPAHDSQRFIILVFDKLGRPVLVVKLGASGRAKELIAEEVRFLESVPEGTPGIPRVRDQFTSSYWRCFAMNYFQGGSPAREGEVRIPELLTGWLDRTQTIRLGDCADWIALSQAPEASGLLQRLAPGVRERTFHPAIQHGDFAPWNIKVSREGNWMALDWERGRLRGIPAWDWFHYVVQTAVLVQRKPTTVLIEMIDQLLASSAFKTYADAAGFAGIERELLLGYLLHCIHVIRQAEGLPQIRRLSEAAFQRWRS